MTDELQKKLQELGTNQAVIQHDIAQICKTIEKIDGKLDEEFVRKIEFEPVRKLVYGVVGLILTGVMGALISLVLMK